AGFHPGLRFRLIQLVLLAVLPALGLIVYAAHEQRQTATKAAENDALRLARIASVSQERLVDSTRQLLLALARLPEVRRRESRECALLFSDMRSQFPLYANLGAATADGEIFCSAQPMAKPINIADRRYFRQAIQRRDFAVGEYQVGRVTGKASLNFGYPVFFDNASTVGAVVYAALDLDWLNQLVTAAQLPENSTLTVSDHEGTILARYPDSERWLGKSISNTGPAKFALGKREGIADAKGFDGERRLYGFTSLAGTQHKVSLYVTVGVPKETALADVNRALRRNLSGLAAVSILALIAAWYGGDVFVLRQLKVLVKTTERLGAGDLGTRTGLPHNHNEVGRLAASMDKMSEVLEARRAEALIANQRIARNLERMKALHDINIAITSTLNLGAMLNLLLEKIDLALPKAVATIRLIDNETGELEPMVCRNIDEATWRSVTPRFPHRLAKLVLENKGPLYIANIQTDPRSEGHGFARRFGLISYLGVPLIAKGDLLGLIAFYIKEEHSFNDDEIEFLTTLAGHLAIAIHNAKLYEETRRSAGEISALHAVTLTATQSLDLDLVLNEAVKKVTAIFRFDATRVFLFNPGMDELRVRAAFEVKPELWAQVSVFKRDQGIVGSVVETGESFICEDIRNDSRYLERSYSRSLQKAQANFFAVLPIKTKFKVWGAMVCVGEAPRKLKNDEVRLLTSMTNQIGIAVENATLYEQTATKAKELSSLYSLVGIASESLDINLVLRKTMHKVLEIFGFDAARIYLYQDNTKELHLIVCQGIPDDVSPKIKYQLGEGIVGKVAEAGEPLVFGNMRTDPLYDKIAGFRVMLKAGFRGSFFIPIRVRGETLGVMNLLSKEPHEFSESEVRLINSIAYHLGIAAGNASLFSQLRRKTAELEVANKAKNEFLGVVSHELRTPLNVIKGYTELLMDKALGDINAEQETALERITAQSRDLLNMINDVLQVTLIEANAVNLESSVLNLHDFLDKLKADYDIPRGKKLTVNWDYPSDLPVINTDEHKLKALLRNLVTNAIKFTETGSVTISVRHYAADIIDFRIVDTGIGIPKEKLRSIFDMFQQADSSATREYGGVGLGLYIVKKFTELLGGTVGVKSELGKGTCFTVKIPAETSLSRRAYAKPETDHSFSQSDKT
ncbi:MAG: GAF domain-containing protein, partial [Candidatus Binatia bacterium]